MAQHSMVKTVRIDGKLDTSTLEKGDVVTFEEPSGRRGSGPFIRRGAANPLKVLIKVGAGDTWIDESSIQSIARRTKGVRK
mgnify:CR=1 FL=1